MAELTFVALMAVGIAFFVFALLMSLVLAIHITVIEVKHWRRVRRIRKARLEMVRREIANEVVRKRVQRRVDQIKHNEKFAEGIRRVLNER